MLEQGSRWSRVEVDGPTDVEGWVNNAFIEKQPEAPVSAVGRVASKSPPAAGKAGAKRPR